MYHLGTFPLLNDYYHNLISSSSKSSKPLMGASELLGDKELPNTLESEAAIMFTIAISVTSIAGAIYVFFIFYILIICVLQLLNYNLFAVMDINTLFDWFACQLRTTQSVPSIICNFYSLHFSDTCCFVILVYYKAKRS